MSKLIITTEEELQRIIADSLKKHFSTNVTPVGQEVSTKKYLSTGEAAAYLNMAKHSLYRYTSNRTIPFIKGAKLIRFLKSDLDAWLEQGRKKSKSQIRAEIASGQSK